MADDLCSYDYTYFWQKVEKEKLSFFFHFYYTKYNFKFIICNSKNSERSEQRVIMSVPSKDEDVDMNGLATYTLSLVT